MHQIQFGATLLRNRAAQYTTPVLEHEVHLFRGDSLGSDDKISFVLAILVIHDDHELSFFEVF